MDMSFTTLTEWNQQEWEKLKPIYKEAFPHGAKPESILRSMLGRGIATLHGGFIGDEAAAMAVTGLSGPQEARNLILDYMAVRKDLRGQGFGSLFLRQIRGWAVQKHAVKAIIIEAEAEDSDINRARLSFWERSGFISTAYVHTYIWVPEPYRALALPLDPEFEVKDEGQSLFRSITAFHEKAYRNTFSNTGKSDIRPE
ncbi:GNAT family N-acetyltransferase [Paenibacillus pinistramenti]|uniref:GNAT family N-acetyltransferase n=1 Tax=Paenibacillus pinistramenti TaxID=1768003 RepID=UPI0011081259|nr:GNAT family N-acetyltransferase [Paenibacillus pinistramenti]